MDSCTLQDMLYMTVSDVKTTDDEVIFTMDEGSRFKFFHVQDCCEDVGVSGIEGDLQSLVGAQITGVAENVTTGDDYDSGSWTKTVYTFRTEKSEVKISWLGTSNGYYSEGVDLMKFARTI